MATQRLKLAGKEVDIELLRGRGYRLALTWGKDGAPHDLTSHKARFKAKVNVSDSSAVIDLSETDGITLGDGQNNIEIIIPGTPTASLDVKELRYWFELEDPAAVTKPMLTGDLVLSDGA